MSNGIFSGRMRQLICLNAQHIVFSESQVNDIFGVKPEELNILSRSFGNRFKRKSHKNKQSCFFLTMISYCNR